MKESMDMENQDPAKLSPDEMNRLRSVAQKVMWKGPGMKTFNAEESAGAAEILQEPAAEQASTEGPAPEEGVAKESPEQIAPSFEDAGSFEELDALIDKSGGVQGSEEFFEPDALKSIIDRVRKGEIGSEYITRAGGLRAKVLELLEMEQPEKQEAVADAEAVPQEEIPAQEEAEGELSLEAIGKKRLEWVIAKTAEVQGRVQGYGTSLWEKAKDYTAKGAKAIGDKLKKAVYVTFALPEALDASDRAIEEFFGEKYAALIDASNAKYKEIADKVTGIRSAFTERVKSAQERRQKSRDLIEASKEEIRAHKAKIAEARKNLLFRML